MSQDIKTPFGKITPDVSLFPIYYLLFIYGFVYIFPYGKNLIGISWFDWIRSEDGPLEWLQFFEYVFSSFLAFLIFLRRKKKGKSTLLFGYWWPFIINNRRRGNKLGWKVNWNRISSISDLNVQGETNFHNLPFFHNYLLDPVFEISCIFLGWFGWRKFKNVDAFPLKNFLFIFYLLLFFIFILIFHGHQQLNK